MIRREDHDIPPVPRGRECIVVRLRGDLVPGEGCQGEGSYYFLKYGTSLSCQSRNTYICIAPR
jgi:hypothetical protein